MYLPTHSFEKNAVSLHATLLMVRSALLSIVLGLYLVSQISYEESLTRNESPDLIQLSGKLFRSLSKPSPQSLLDQKVNHPLVQFLSCEEQLPLETLVLSLSILNTK